MNNDPDRAGPPPSMTAEDPDERGLAAAREIADSVRSAASPLEAYRLALARITPLVGAAFASVFERDPSDPRLLRLVCAHNWPQPVARYIGELRIMAGRGPTGRAGGSNQAVVVPDVFADEALEEWWEPARELGFVSMIALPLARAGRAFGVLSFYFTRTRSFDERDRRLLDVVARRLAAMAAAPHPAAGGSGDPEGSVSDSRPAPERESR